MPNASISLDAALAQPFGAIADLVALHAAQRPRHAALVLDDRVATFGELDAAADRVAAALQRDGVAPCDVVAVSAANSIEYAAVLLGTLRAGAAIAPVPQTTAPAALAAMIDDSGATHAFVDDAVLRVLAPHRASLRARIVALDGAQGAQALLDWQAGVSRPGPVTIEPGWPFNVIYSSGTTGTPKGIVQPHAMRWAHVQRASTYGYGPQAVTLISTPLHSNTTLVSFLPALALGGAVVLMAKFDAGRYLELAERHRVTHTMLVPVQYQRILAHPDFARRDLSSYRAKFSTSAPFAEALKRDVLARWPGGLTEFYGMTEGGGTCILACHEHRDKLRTVGRPAPGTDMRVIDEVGQELSRGEIGEVVGHSPAAMMTGYHNKPEATAAAEWFDAQGKRYIRTGDVGRFDDDGFLVLLDRRKDMIISGGFNVYPSDLEAILRTHPDVLEVAVVGMPSAQWGETPVAFVVRAGGAAVDADALREWANAQLGKLQRLAAVRVLDALPRSPIGKILKRELRARYAGDFATSST